MNALKIPLVAGLMLGLGLGCASTHAPATLVEARSTYDSAQTGRAGEVAPDELYEAKKALQSAEASFKEDGDSWETRTRAYIALRKAERAKIIADDRDEVAKIDRREDNKDALAERMRKDATKDLAQTKDQLEESKVLRAQAEAARVQAETEAEAARAKLKETTDKLKEIAQIQENERGLVISLSSGILFASGKSTLLAPAFPKLDQIANVLKQQPDRTITVEGHTDSAGPDSANMVLSQARAESVRAYLVSQGVSSAHVSAVGMGESKPIADNNTTEGRANNRRVEIVLSPLTVKMP